jgi:protease-4
MIYRRDLFFGVLLLSFLCVLVIAAFLMIVSVAVDGVHVSEKRIAVIEISGAIISPKSPVEKLERYITDKNIPAIVIRLNTLGGGISATQEIYETVRKARSAGKKVIATMGTVAASGGYYIAAACDSIVATPGTITGSIGVIATIPDFSGLYQKIGINFNVIKAGKYKDIGSSSRKMTEEEKALLDSVITDHHEQFMSVVSEGRKLQLDFVRSIADGRVFTGRQALKLGLVDRLGTYQDAIDLAGVMVGIGKNPPVLKETRGLFREVFIDEMSNILLGGLELKIPQISYIFTY